MNDTRIPVAGPCRHKPEPERCASCILDSSEYFAGLGLDTKLTLQQHLRFGAFARRETLYAEGAESRNLYLLISGQVKVYKSLSSGRHQIHKLAMIPGDLITCEDMFLDRHSSSAESIDAVTVCYLSKQHMMQAMARHPEISGAMMRTMARNLNSYVRHVSNLGPKSALERLAAYLAFMHETHRGEPTHRSVLTEPLTRHEIADMLGITERTLIRGLKTLERERVIALQRDGFVILDPHALIRLGDGH